MNHIPEDYDYVTGKSPAAERERQMNQLVTALLLKKPSWSRRRARRWIEREEQRARANG